MLTIKYCPETLEETNINNHIVKSLKNYLLKNTNNVLYNLYGDSGSGKTTIIKLILKELHKKYIEINYTTKNMKNCLEEKIYFMKNYSNKTILLIEDIEYVENDIINILKSYPIDNIKIILVSINKIDIKNLEIINDYTYIKNFKIYKSFIIKILKKEKIRKKNIDCHLKYYKNNIRDCINNLVQNNSIDLHHANSIEQILMYINNNDSFFDKFNCLYSSSLNMIFTIYENIYFLEKINIQDKINILKNVIECDQHNTYNFENKLVDSTNYITCRCISTLQLSQNLNVKNIVASKIWSLYSNKCTKQLKFYDVCRLHSNLYFSIKFLFYLSFQLNNFIIDDNRDELKKIVTFYNINNACQFKNILKFHLEQKKISQTLLNYLYKK